MDWREVRDALRVLRAQSGKSVRGIPGLDKSTVYRIENTRDIPDYTPELSSVQAILRACGTSFGAFFAKLERLTAADASSDVLDILSALSTDEKVQQVRAFLALPEPVQRALVLASPGMSGPTQSPGAAPTHERRQAKRTKAKAGPRRSSARGTINR